jgi:hypothetical protein
MGAFFSSMFSELGQRRRRIREALGDRGAAIGEFITLGGLAAGSLGMFLGPWMAAKAPWGFAVPLLFLVGYGLLDLRRQKELAGGADNDKIAVRYDWLALALSFACAMAGAAAFVIAWSGKPAPPQQDWRPPAHTIVTDIVP